MALMLKGVGHFDSAHRSGSGRKTYFGYQSKFLLHMLVWCLDYHKIQKRKNSAGGPSLTNLEDCVSSSERSSRKAESPNHFIE